jgi:hypothetical protein
LPYGQVLYDYNRETGALETPLTGVTRAA